MAGEYAPPAITAMFERLRELRPNMGLELGGIVGDAAHSSGYHRARAVLAPYDYSCVLQRDQHGDEWACSAIDITPAGDHAAAVMRFLTRQLAQAAARRDHRLTRAVREFYGTLDSEHVFGYDVRWKQASRADASHLWHVHLSFYRVHATDPEVLLPVADVLAGPRHDLSTTGE